MDIYFSRSANGYRFIERIIRTKTPTLAIKGDICGPSTTRSLHNTLDTTLVISRTATIGQLLGTSSQTEVGPPVVAGITISMIDLIDPWVVTSH